MTDSKKEILIPKESYEGEEIIISKGRKVKLKSPTMLDLYHLNKACKSGDKLDEDLRVYADILNYIDKIDGKSQPSMYFNSIEILDQLAKFKLEDFSKIRAAIDKSQEEVTEEIKK